MIHEKTSGGELARLSFTARDLVGWLQNLTANQRPVTKSAGQVRSKLLAGLEQSFRWRITSSICLWNSSVSTTQALKCYLLLSSHLSLPTATSITLPTAYIQPQNKPEMLALRMEVVRSVAVRAMQPLV